MFDDPDWKRLARGLLRMAIVAPEVLGTRPPLPLSKGEPDRHLDPFAKVLAL